MMESTKNPGKLLGSIHAANIELQWWSFLRYCTSQWNAGSYKQQLKQSCRMMLFLWEC